MIQYYDEIEKSNCQELDRIIFNCTERQYKEEKREFFKHHKYVFGILNDREIEILNLYYGLVDGKCRTFEEISSIYGCGRANIARILTDLKIKLHRPIVYKLLSKGYTDEDLGCTFENLNEFNVETLEKLLKAELRNEEIVKKERYELLSEEDKKAELCFDLVLGKLFYRYFDNCEELLRGVKTKNASVSTILSLDESVVNVPENVDVIRAVHSLGLKFKCEEEFEQDWRESCVQGIKNYGINNIMEHFGINSLSSSALNEFLRLGIDSLDLSVRANNVLKYNDIYTIEDVLNLGKEKLKSLRNLGELSFNDIVSKINSLGYDLCPDEYSPDIWITRIKDIIDPHEVISQQTPKSSEQEFEELMATPLEELKFTLRTYNALERFGISTIGDLVNTCEKDLNKVRYLCDGKKEVIEKVNGLGLSFRSEEITRDLWLDKLKQKYVGDSPEKTEKTESIAVLSSDTTEFESIPEKYKYLCAIGAGVVAEQGVKENIDIYSSFGRNQGKDEDLKVQVCVVDDGDRSLNTWNFLEDNIKNINYLDEQFIADNREVLRLMVYQNKNITMSEKVELLEFINNPKYFERV